MQLNSKIKKLRDELDKLYQLESSMAVLGYDQQVFMPAGAAQGRARQLEYLSELHHEQLCSDMLWGLVQELNQNLEELNSDDKIIVKELFRSIEKNRKLPVSFVKEKSRVSSESFNQWCQSRDKNEWQAVKPYLKRIVELSRDEAKLLGFVENPYDALLDSFEPYATVSKVKPILISLAERLKVALDSLVEKYSSVAEAKGHFSIDQQEQACKQVLKKLGFDFNIGRLDTAAHPFMSTLGPRDIRVTTRYNEKSFFPALFGCIHEFGHALYEIGLPQEFRGTARGSAVSMAIHESQSRFWENVVGRSRPFCLYIQKLVQDHFSISLEANQIYSQVNQVRKSLIRVEADEVSYSLHIVIRLILEDELINGLLEVEDLPARWDSLYLEYLGLRVPDFRQGLMQDVHWYSGSIGYFPSYALGNLYASMFTEAMSTDIGPLAILIEEGRFLDLGVWLHDKIHRLGQSYQAQALAEHVCGKNLTIEPFLSYLSAKHELSI
jgi:carboxypeptidase Taq